MPMHMESECIKKPVPCPYLDIGCSTALPVAELATHVEDDVDKHLWKLLLRVQV